MPEAPAWLQLVIAAIGGSGLLKLIELIIGRFDRRGDMGIKLDERAEMLRQGAFEDAEEIRQWLRDDLKSVKDEMNRVSAELAIAGRERDTLRSDHKECLALTSALRGRVESMEIRHAVALAQKDQDHKDAMSLAASRAITLERALARCREEMRALAKEGTGMPFEEGEVP